LPLSLNARHVDASAYLYKEEEDIEDLFQDGAATAVDTDGDNEFLDVPDDDKAADPVLQANGAPLVENPPPPHLLPPQPVKPCSAMPKWLTRDYADLWEHLVAEMKKNATRKPTCYERGSFLDGVPYPFFFADQKYQPTLEDFYWSSYFVWLPHLLIDRIPCPTCKIRGKTIFLCCNGWAKAPRRVVDIEGCIFIIGYRYYCRDENCKKTYQSWSPALLSALPQTLSMEFSHHLTYRGGLTNRVVNLM
jgi:hypothetical protein